MSIFQAFILGLIQGLGEFLPISSSAHLVVAPWLLKWEDHGLAFDLVLHWGTLLAVLVYFKNDIWLLAKGFWHSLFKSTRNFQGNIYQKLSWFIIFASIPGAIIGKIFEKQAETVFREPWLVALNLCVFGVVILAADSLGKKQKNLDKMTWKNSVVIGLCQALAIVPGVSRSGSTITAGLAQGLTRADSARFSFLMSIPIIFGAGLLKIGDFGGNVPTISLVVGFLTAAVSGFLAIKYLLKYVSQNSFNIFVWYRFIFAAIIVLIIFLRS